MVGFQSEFPNFQGPPIFRCKNFTSLHRGDATEALSEELTNDLLGGMKNDGKAAAEALLELLYLAKKEGAEVTLVTLGVVVGWCWLLKGMHGVSKTAMILGLCMIFFFWGSIPVMYRIRCNYNYYRL